MEKIDIRDCFPVMNGGDGVILSKRGDICVGWEMSLPPAFRCNEEKYDSIISTLNAAIALLPDYSIVHKQDIYMKKKYASEKAKGLLNESYERHFDGREYLDHRCRLFVTFSNKNNVKGSPSGIAGMGAGKIPGSERHCQNAWGGRAVRECGKQQSVTGTEKACRRENIRE